MTDLPKIQKSPLAPISHSRVLKIALPIVLSNATMPILGMVDTGVVGQMGLAAPIGAVGIGAVILASTYWIFGFLRMGTTGLVAQARGAGDPTEVSAFLTRVLAIGFLGGLIVIALQTPILWAAFKMAPASDEVESLARSYIGIRIWSAPFNIALFGIIGWLIALERSRAVLILQLWMNGLNIALDLWFVIGLGWGVEGVAFATVLAEISGAGFGLYLCRDAFARPAWRDWAVVVQHSRLVRMAQVNSDIMIRSIFLLSVMVSFSFLSAGFGDVPLAANQILLQFVYITAYALDGFAFAAEAIVGQAMGARLLSHLRRGAIVSTIWGGVAAVGMSLCFAVFGRDIIDFMTTAPEVRGVAYDFLPWMIGVPVLGLASWMLDGIFIGATRSRDMRNMMVLSLLAYVLAVLTMLPLFGNHGLWAALLISYIVRGVTLMWKYPRLEAEVCP